MYNRLYITSIFHLYIKNNISKWYTFSQLPLEDFNNPNCNGIIFLSIPVAKIIKQIIHSVKIN